MTSNDQSKSKARARHKGAARQRAPERIEPPSANLPGELGWRERAAFHVSFEDADDDAGVTHWQIHTYHEESDSHTVWAGVPGASMLAWMCDKAGLARVAAFDEEPGDMHLTLGELRIDEVTGERQAGGPGRATYLRAEIDFTFTSPAFDPHAEQARSITQLLAWNAATAGLTTLASTQQQLHPDAGTTTATLELDLPGLGDYQLIAMILLPEQRIVGAALGPMLSIIP
jgi:hypothetical protein